MKNKSIILTLILLAILAFGAVAFMPELAAAESGRNIHYGPLEDDNDSPSVSSGNASSGAYFSDGGGRNTTIVTEYRYVERTASRPATSVETEPVEESEQEISDMAANAIFGSNSFMPSGIVQWVLFAIFILLVVILVRRFFGAEQAYHASPLKHD